MHGAWGMGGPFITLLDSSTFLALSLSIFLAGVCLCRCCLPPPVLVAVSVSHSRSPCGFPVIPAPRPLTRWYSAVFSRSYPLVWALRATAVAYVALSTRPTAALAAHRAVRWAAPSPRSLPPGAGKVRQPCPRRRSPAPHLRPVLRRPLAMVAPDGGHASWSGCGSVLACPPILLGDGLRFAPP